MVITEKVATLATAGRASRNEKGWRGAGGEGAGAAEAGSLPSDLGSVRWVGFGSARRWCGGGGGDGPVRV